MVDLNILKIAQEIANINKTKHCAIIMGSGNIMATGVNKTEATRKKLMKLYGPCDTGRSVHAEYDAIYNLIKLIRFGTDNTNIRRKKLDIYIAKRDMGNSKPCQHCINILQHFGIYRVYYTMSENDYICEKINNIENEHVSYGNRRYHEINNIK